MPRLDVTPAEWETMKELMAAGSVFIEYGSWEWKLYETLRVKLRNQAER